MRNRRDILRSLGGVTTLALANTLVPGLAFGNAPTDKRLVIVILRGGMDGIAALAPYGDKNYARVRGDLSFKTDALLRVDPFFGLHPSLEVLATMYKDGDMIAIPATATPYRDRSHFDAQNVLELGSTEANALPDGWLNRLVGTINNHDDLAIAFGQGLPTMLRGDNDVNSWEPSALPDAGDDFMRLVQRVYAHDDRFARNFTKALDIQNMGIASSNGNKRRMARESRSPDGFVALAEIAGEWLARPDGPRIATLEMDGWDTHVQQGREGGRLANNFDIFARGVEGLRTNLGSDWSKTIVVALTEFGRTARPNGSAGTDHGTASTVFLMGGALKGGRIVHQWPGLHDSDLYEGRDLRPTIDMRAILKGVLQDHYALSSVQLAGTVFPGSANVKPILGLV